MDTELVMAHRRECGSPDPPPADEIECPELPAGNAFPAFRAAGTPGYPAPVPAGPRTYPSPAAATTRPQFSPMPPKTAPSPAAVATQMSSGTQSELKLISNFVQEWDLESTRTKLLLARLSPTRRRAVIEGFTVSPGEGPAVATKALERYIAENESGAGAARPSTPGPQPVKRPLLGASTSGTSAYGTYGDPKRQRIDGLGSAGAYGSSTYGARAPMAARPASVSTPAVSRPKAASAAPAKKSIPFSAKPGDLIKNLLGGL